MYFVVKGVGVYVTAVWLFVAAAMQTEFPQRPVTTAFVVFALVTPPTSISTQQGTNDTES
jgi:hypothetical protein